MRRLKIFAAIAIILSAVWTFQAAEAAINFQELRSSIALPVLPERIRYRNTRRGPTKIIVQPKEFPQRVSQQRERNNNYPTYVQRQPKKPPPVYVPRRPTQFPGQRGSYPKKNFGPPRARYVR